MDGASNPQDSLRIPLLLLNHRGAAFLLSVYLSALALLLLSGIALQRTNLDARAAQLFRDKQQALFLAEAGLDQTLQRFKANPLIADETASRTFSLMDGTVAVETTTPANAIQEDGSEVRKVTLTATKNGLSQRIYAVFKLTGEGAMPFREGLLGDEEVFVGTSGHNGGILNINGPVGSRGGSVGAVVLFNTKVSGPVFIGSPHYAPDNLWKFIGPTTMFDFWRQSYNRVYEGVSYGKGVYVPGMAGFGWHGSGVMTINSEFSGYPVVTDPPVPARPDLDAPAVDTGGCGGGTAGSRAHDDHLWLRSGESLRIEDGGRWDADGARNEHIAIYKESITLEEGSQLIFDKPATVYLTSNERPWEPGPIVNCSLRNALDGVYVQQANAVIGVQPTSGGAFLRNGVELVIPTQVYEEAGRTVIGITGQFYGSIWAPKSWVFLFDESKDSNGYVGSQVGNGRLTTPPIRTFGQMVWLYSDRPAGAPTFTLKASSDDGSPAPRKLEVSLVHWSLEGSMEEGESLDQADADNLAFVEGEGKVALRITHNEEGAPSTQWEYDPYHWLD